MKDKLIDFLKDYEGFNYKDGEIVLVNRDNLKSYICTWDGEVLKHPFHKFNSEIGLYVYSWGHSEKNNDDILWEVKIEKS